jgi:hypothetical protein
VGKVKAVQGDIQLPGIGLSQSDRARLMRSVDVIIHCAADIRLEPTIQETLQVSTHTLAPHAVLGSSCCALAQGKVMLLCTVGSRGC